MQVQVLLLLLLLDLDLSPRREAEWRFCSVGTLRRGGRSRSKPDNHLSQSPGVSQRPASTVLRHQV